MSADFSIEASDSPSPSTIEDHAVDDEQPADDAADVEQVRRLRGALRVDLALVVLLVWGSSAMSVS